MKKFTLALLTIIFLISCNQQSKKEDSNSKETFVKTDDNSSSDSENEKKEEPKAEVAALEDPVKEYDVLSFDGDNEEKSEYHEIEFKLGKGYLIYEEEARYTPGPKDYFCNEFELKKDGKTIFTQKEEEDYNFPFRSRKFHEELPRIATKGNKTAFIHEMVKIPNDIFYRALLFENDQFVKAVNVNKTILGNQEELEELFEKF